MFTRVHGESKAACVAGSRVFHGEFGFFGISICHLDVVS